MKPGRHSKLSNKKGVLTKPKSRSQANVAGYEKRLARKAKLNREDDEIIVSDDDKKIASDDDEELDSDAAFEEGDEERFEDFFSHKVCVYMCI